MRTKFVGLLIFASAAFASCSSEQTVVEPVKISDLVNTGCKTSISATESRPEFYEDEIDKPTMVTVSVDENGVASFLVSDLKENCTLKEFRPQVTLQENEITIVLFPYIPDPTILADCICDYDVSFNISDLTFGKYRLKVYRSDYYGKYDAGKPAYDGVVSFSSNKTFQFELQ